MKKKLNCILLIDDDKDCNFFHVRLFKKLDCAERIEVATDGVMALEYLQSVVNGLNPNPEIIFLDINMPRMNGWEFLKKYEVLGPEIKAKILVVMLTTSLNPDDREKAKNFKDIGEFRIKYLSKETFLEIIKVHFPDHL